MICYTFIRQDMDIQHQLVQACHSAYEAGSNFKDTKDIPYLICLGMNDDKELKSAEEFLRKHDIQYHKFFEPDNNLGHTSISTEPLDWEQKKLFSNFRLWKYKPELINQEVASCN